MYFMQKKMFLNLALKSEIQYNIQKSGCINGYSQGRTGHITRWEKSHGTLFVIWAATIALSFLQQFFWGAP
jgi:hypothetical protein